MSNQRPTIVFEQLIDLSQFQSYQENFICKVCKKILLNPVACSSCKNVYCRDCIMPYAINTNKCPNECTEFELIKPDEEMLKRYNEFEIICKICENTFSLTTYYTHYKKCKKDAELQKCFNCGTEKMGKFINYQSISDFELDNNYKSKQSFKFDNPFLICISTNSFSGYITYIKDYLIVTNEKINASIFSEIIIDDKTYIKILYEKNGIF